MRCLHNCVLLHLAGGRHIHDSLLDLCWCWCWDRHGLVNDLSLMLDDRDHHWSRSWCWLGDRLDIHNLHILSTLTNNLESILLGVALLGVQLVLLLVLRLHGSLLVSNLRSTHGTVRSSES